MMGARGRTLLVTYCCRDKADDPGELPAVRRYLSPRIGAADEAARRLGWDFAILSGLFGLLGPQAPLEYYDYLLTEDQVADHARRVAGQLEETGAKTLVFLTREKTVDPGAVPYRRCVEDACRRAGVSFTLHTIGRVTPTGGELAAALPRS